MILKGKGCILIFNDEGEITETFLLEEGGDMLGVEIEAEINIINVQSYPTVGGNWKVRFTTNGTADLIITAVNGTTFGDALPDDLKFLELNNGTHTLDPEIDGQFARASARSGNSFPRRL